MRLGFKKTLWIQALREDRRWERKYRVVAVSQDGPKTQKH